MQVSCLNCGHEIPVGDIHSTHTPVPNVRHSRISSSVHVGIECPSCGASNSLSIDFSQYLVEDNECCSVLGTVDNPVRVSAAGANAPRTTAPAPDAPVDEQSDEGEGEGDGVEKDQPPEPTRRRRAAASESAPTPTPEPSRRRRAATESAPTPVPAPVPAPTPAPTATRRRRSAAPDPTPEPVAPFDMDKVDWSDNDQWLDAITAGIATLTDEQFADYQTLLSEFNFDNVQKWTFTGITHPEDRHDFAKDFLTKVLKFPAE